MCAALVHEDQKILVVQRGYFLVQGGSGLGIGYLTVLSRNLQNHDAGQLSELPPREGGVFVRHGDGLAGGGL